MTITLIGCAIYTGPIYGWGSLELIFIKEGFYRGGCSNSDPEVECRSQRSLLTLMYTL